MPPASAPSRRSTIASRREALRRFPHEDRGKLFRTWLTADPRWGFGWIAWALCHFSPAVREGPRDYVKAERLLREGYATPGVRNRDAIAAWLKVLCEKAGRRPEARAVEELAKKLRRQAERKPGEKSTHKTRALTVSERVALDDGSDDASVLRRRTTLTFGDQGLPLDQLLAIMAALRPPPVPLALQHAPKMG